MPDNQTLKPCPVCSGTSLNTATAYVKEKQQICCETYDCGVRGPIGQSYVHAVSLWNQLPRSSDTEPPKLRPCEFYTGEWRPALFVQYYTLQEELEHWNIVAIVQVEEHQEYVPLNWFHFTDRAAAVTDTKEKA